MTAALLADAPVDVLATRRDAHGEAPAHYAATAPLSPAARAIEDEIRALYPRLQAAAGLSGGGVGNASRRLAGGDRFVLSGFFPYTPYGDGVPRTVTIDIGSGRIVEGTAHAGLIEVAPLYLAAHRVDAAIGAIIHTHAPELASFAVARRPLPLRILSARAALGGASEIPVTRWGTRYEPEPIVDILRAHPGTPALIHGNHGPFVFGPDLISVFRHLALLESVAGIELKAARLAA